MMGHASLATTALYTRVSREKQRDAILQLGRDLPDSVTYPEPRAHRPTKGVVR